MKTGRTTTRLHSLILCTLLALLGCGADTAGPQADEALEEETISLFEAAGEEASEYLRAAIEPWKGDFDGMVERRVVRALVTANRTAYFLDGAQERGVAYELLRELEKKINSDLRRGHLKVHVLLIPVSRDRLIPDLLEGRGDLAAANLTITTERQELVDFSDPLLSNVAEIVVTGPGAPVLTSLEDLSGREVFVRPSSSYRESIESLNESLRAAGKPPAILNPANEQLETEDILEMVNAGLIPITIADSYLAEFWSQIYDGMTLHPQLAVRSGGQIAWAFRKKSSELEKVVNAFVKDHKKGTLMGNILFKRYLRSTEWVENSLDPEGVDRFRQMVDLFQHYGDQYGFDHLKVTAQGYQESRLDQSLRSSAGAIGVMQLLPSTAADPNVGIPDIEGLENNIHAGTKYLRFIVDHYFADEDLDPVNTILFAFASYNAGPNRIARLRHKTAELGLDPDRWFQNVEVVVAREVGREPVQYVSNIFKYYVAYAELTRRLELRERAQRGN